MTVISQWKQRCSHMPGRICDAGVSKADDNRGATVDLRRLAVFAMVVRRRSFTRAAEDLHLSQSAVSQQIAALEAEFGAQLLDRSRRRVALTPAGAALEEWATRLLADGESARRAVAAAQGRMTGALRVAASLTVATYLLPRPLAELIRAH